MRNHRVNDTHMLLVSREEITMKVIFTKRNPNFKLVMQAMLNLTNQFGEGLISFFLKLG